MPDIRSDIYSNEPWGPSVSSSKPNAGRGNPRGSSGFGQHPLQTLPNGNTAHRFTRAGPGTDLQPMSRLLMVVVDRGRPPAMAPSVEHLSSELRPGGCGLLESPSLKRNPGASHRQSGEQGENRRWDV
ncbi:unnamed protein product [Arctogadus glacialis]